jgi:hypothetical protein
VALASAAPGRAAAVPVFYQAVQVVALFIFSISSWKAGSDTRPLFGCTLALFAEDIRRLGGIGDENGSG